MAGSNSLTNQVPHLLRWIRLRSIHTLDEGLKSRRDNFLLLRFLAASLVIYRHGGAMTGGAGFRDFIPWLGWGTDSGKVAVDIFFLVSGFMISGSYLRRQHLPDFLWARVLRIFPAYLLCLVLCAFVLGAIYTKLPVWDYYRSPDVIHYVLQNLKLQSSMVWQLPGVFTDNPQRATINGSIWTLPAEAHMYLWVALLGLLGVISRRWLGSLIIAALFAVGMIWPESNILMLPDIYLHVAGMFGLGAICYIHRDIIPAGWPCFLLLAGLAFLLRNTPAYPFAFGIALAQFCFAFAYCIPWHGFNRLGDYSYGLYLWGCPMQQTIAHHFPTLSPMGNSLLAFPLALALGVLSWHLLEKQALKLKRVPSQLWKKWKLQSLLPSADSP
jgi:peptidoglycan/LPS O-acetylase OafA/YrhL